MPRLRRTSDWCFWCCLLLAVYQQTLGDEEGLWGPAPSEEPPGEQTPPNDRPGSVRWSPSLPTSSSPLPSTPPGLPFSRWAGDSRTVNETAAEPIDLLSEHSGSGEESLSSSTSGPPATSTQEHHLARVTPEIRTDSVPVGTSDSPHSSSVMLGNNKDPLVSDSRSPRSTSIGDMPFSHSPTSARALARTATHTHPPPPPPGSAQTAENKHVPGERADEEEVEDSRQTEPLTDALTAPPETTVPTALISTYRPVTITPGLVETTVARHPLGSVTHATSPGTVAAATPPPMKLTVSVSVSASTTEVTVTDVQPTRSEPHSGVSEARSGPVEEHVWTLTSATVIKDQHVSEAVTSTSQGAKVNFPILVGTPGQRNEDQTTPTDVYTSPTTFMDIATPPPTPTDASTPPTTRTDASTPPTTRTDMSMSPPTPTDSLTTGGPTTETPYISPHTEDWLIYDPTENEIQLLPDCNQERSGICNLSTTWATGGTTTTGTTTTTTPSDVSIAPGNNATTGNHSANNNNDNGDDNDPFLLAAPPMLVPLYTDWNSAVAAWGAAWEAHVYGAGCAFAAVGLASALNLLCLPLRCPSGCVYFALVSVFLLGAGGTRAFSLLYDAYGHGGRLPAAAGAAAALALREAPFPCLTAAFGLVFLLLSMRSRMQLSYSAFQRPCFLACLVALHFAAAFGPAALPGAYRQRPPLCLSLVSRGAFVALAAFLSAAYFAFYVYVRADSKHIYRLNNTSPTPAERYNRCPFAESRDWDRAAAAVCASALFLLACAGLQLYAMLNAMGVAGGEEVFRFPWPWWAFQLGCRACELGVCLTLALVVAQPIYCADHLPDAGSCWTELLAAKSPMLPGSYQWTLSQQEKLAIVDTGGLLGETESLPLYTLVDERLGSSLNGLDLLYHSNRALAYRDMDLDLDVPCAGNEGGSSFTSDSTADLRPPSPINLRRSIDEALFSEALFPMSLFSPMRPNHCSDLSLTAHNTLPNGGKALRETLLTDPGLYRTSSCVEVTPRPQPPEDSARGALPSPSLSVTSSCSSPERWRGSSSSCCSLYRASVGGSSLVLCPSPGRGPLPQDGNSDRLVSSGHRQQGSTDLQRCYHALGSASQESLDLDLSSEAERSVQEEFITVCRQIDASSVCSETIDL